MWTRIKQEPALLLGVVVAAVALAVAFGVPISEDQSAAITGVVSAVLALLGAGVVRQSVTPTSKLRIPDGLDGFPDLPDDTPADPSDEPIDADAEDES